MELQKTLEAVLFASDEPLTLERLREILAPLTQKTAQAAPTGEPDQQVGETPAPEQEALTNDKDFNDDILKAIEAVRSKYSEIDSPVVVLEVAEGWQFATNPRYSPWVKKLYKNRTSFRLSQAALETLAIISYKQPITRAEIEEIRGVEAIAALETLLERNLIRTAGRKETVGRPILYATSQEFLRQFGLRSLNDLPPLEEAAFSDEAPGVAAQPAQEEGVAPQANADPAALSASEPAVETTAPPQIEITPLEGAPPPSTNEQN